jgi:hypothetical protein
MIDANDFKSSAMVSHASATSAAEQIKQSQRLAHSVPLSFTCKSFDLGDSEGRQTLINHFQSNGCRKFVGFCSPPRRFKRRVMCACCFRDGAAIGDSFR